MGVSNQEGVKYAIQYKPDHGNEWRDCAGYFPDENSATDAANAYNKLGCPRGYCYRVKPIAPISEPAAPPSPASVSGPVDGKISQAEKKPSWALLPLACLIGVLRVLAYGVKKYAKGNWRKATLEDGAPDRYISAAFRHISSMQNPDGTFDKASLAALDDESGLPHIDHAICSLIMLRGILNKSGVLSEDPGMGKEPPSK